MFKQKYIVFFSGSVPIEVDIPNDPAEMDRLWESEDMDDVYKAESMAEENNEAAYGAFYDWAKRRGIRYPEYIDMEVI